MVDRWLSAVGTGCYLAVWTSCGETATAGRMAGNEFVANENKRPNFYVYFFFLFFFCNKTENKCQELSLQWIVISVFCDFCLFLNFCFVIFVLWFLFCDLWFQFSDFSFSVSDLSVFWPVIVGEKKKNVLMLAFFFFFGHCIMQMKTNAQILAYIFLLLLFSLQQNSKQRFVLISEQGGFDRQRNLGICLKVKVYFFG